MSCWKVSRFRPQRIGPGVYDIHSPRCPSTADMTKPCKRAEHLAPEQMGQPGLRSQNARMGGSEERTTEHGAGVKAMRRSA
jgi:hypothetical protein